MSEHALATVQATSSSIASLGAGFYFTPATMERGKELGMPNGLAWYIFGRGSVLGDVDAEMVHSAFAYWEPNLVRKMWDRGHTVMHAASGAAAYSEACRVWGRAAFSDVSNAGRFADLAERIITNAHSAGLALFAGWKVQPLGSADDPAGRAAMACNVLREMRGSINIMAVLCAGMTPSEAHFTAGGASRWKLFGHDEATTPASRPDVHALAEQITDSLTAAAYEVLSPSESEEFVAIVRELKDAVSRNAEEINRTPVAEVAVD